MKDDIQNTPDQVNAGVVGREMAAMIRKGLGDSDALDHTGIIDKLRALTNAPANTSEDALAFAVAAKALVGLFVEAHPNDEYSVTAGYVQELAGRLVDTLEVVSGVNRATFDAHQPYLN